MSLRPSQSTRVKTTQLGLAVAVFGICAIASWLGFFSPVVLFRAGLFAQDRVQPKEVLRKLLQSLDQDGNGKLSETEYTGAGADAPRRRRDFRVFDFDGDKSLIPEELSAIPGALAPADRGPLPDPFDQILENAVAAMDQSYSNWDKNPAATFHAQTFTINFQASISPEGSRRFDSKVMALADHDRNGQVNRAEAIDFLRIQLGIISPERLPIRQANGRILDYTRFEWWDANKDGHVTLQEFRDKDKRPDGAEAFARGDTDHDGRLTIDEFASPTWITHNDPVVEFLKADKNLDGELEPAELDAATGGPRRRHLPYLFPQFDDDGNGKLSLDEFRLTMLGNRFCWWEAEQIDTNRDRLLSFDEFKYNTPAAQLLCRLYFHRFDRDGDGKLSGDEYLFTTKPPDEFHLIPLDGSGYVKLFSNEDYVSCGSPAVSPDGERIAFDGRKGGQTLSNQMIMIVDKNGENLQVLVEGMMPVWSADGKKLCCSRYEPENGIYVMNSDGTNIKQIGTGWGAQWSPDGKFIAYTDNRNVMVYDAATGSKREVLKADENPYQYIYYNACWSPDGKRLAFRGTKEQGADIASIAMVGDKVDLQVHFTTTEPFDNDLAWSADGTSLFFAWQPGDAKKKHIHRLTLGANEPPQLVPGQNPDWSYSNVTITRDGRALISAAQP